MKVARFVYLWHCYYSGHSCFVYVVVGSLELDKGMWKVIDLCNVLYYSPFCLFSFRCE